MKTHNMLLILYLLVLCNSLVYCGFPLSSARNDIHPTHDSPSSRCSCRKCKTCAK